LSSLLVLLLIRGLPGSALFPYTTLFRSNVNLDIDAHRADPSPPRWEAFLTPASHRGVFDAGVPGEGRPVVLHQPLRCGARGSTEDRKSTRLNSSHVKNSYAVFCLKKKTN